MRVDVFLNKLRDFLFGVVACNTVDGVFKLVAVAVFDCPLEGEDWVHAGSSTSPSPLPLEVL